MTIPHFRGILIAALLTFGIGMHTPRSAATRLRRSLARIRPIFPLTSSRSFLPATKRWMPRPGA
ncbi:hypothetical protein [Burkholderia pyrrocinia]|uniref:hypothetical protein n=1 Tax=Burkholderia pyrrocinia TaxID=60550 RepID=UPI001FB49EF3|nr:hypothetical protein [Burkholderia pyrrocinia]UOB58134.1 hypothetical protein MRS60_28585 [Burkholderia pyrrocinia]